MSIAREQSRVEELRASWERFRAENRRAFRYDAARAFGVSEAELLAVECGAGVTRLEGDWRDLLKEFHRLGRIMTLTRNEYAVHEKHGYYRPVSFNGLVGLVLDEDIDLRLFMRSWALGFAVHNPGARLERSFQFFDAAGRSIHKVFVGAEAAEAFDDLVDRFRSVDQSPEQAVNAPVNGKAERPDAEIDLPGLREAWANLQDTHDFHPLLKRFDATRTQAFRLAGPEFAVPLDLQVVPWLIGEAHTRELPIMIFAGNPGCIQIHTGPVAKPVETGGWLNVFGADFTLHLRREGVTQAWLTRKPTADGDVTSVELFDASGRDIAYIYGKRKPGIPELESWRALCREIRERFALSPAA